MRTATKPQRRGARRNSIRCLYFVIVHGEFSLDRRSCGGEPFAGCGVWRMIFTITPFGLATANRRTPKGSSASGRFFGNLSGCGSLGPVFLIAAACHDLRGARRRVPPLCVANAACPELPMPWRGVMRRWPGCWACPPSDRRHDAASNFVGRVRSIVRARSRAARSR